MNETHHWRFDPLDTWFFREARGFETSGHNELSSLFPPPARTVAGAIRTLIGEQHDVDWSRFRTDDQYASLRDLIGDGDSLGHLQLRGPYPLWNGERLYPAPLHLLGKDGDYRFLEPGEAVTCDLGPVRLPRIRQDNAGTLRGAKPLEGHWLRPEDLQLVLAGKPPERIISPSELYDEEPRLGIARDYQRRTGQDGLLYQTRHLRPREGLAIGAETRGLSADQCLKPGVIRFGGEGRPSAISLIDQPPGRLAAPKAGGQRLLLMLLTPADFGQASDDSDSASVGSVRASHGAGQASTRWLPPGFKPIERDGERIWQGEIQGLEGIRLTIECAVLGKAVREGGWDLARQRPRPVRSLVPAGSLYFCTLEGDPASAIPRLHGAHIGQDTALGRGELAVGIW